MWPLWSLHHSRVCWRTNPVVQTTKSIRSMRNVTISSFWSSREAAAKLPEVKLEISLGKKEEKITTTPLQQYLATKKQKRREEAKRRTEENRRQREEDKEKKRQQQVTKIISPQDGYSAKKKWIEANLILMSYQVIL